MIPVRKMLVGAIFSAAAATLGACASAPVHYYTLVARDGEEPLPAGPDTGGAIRFELLTGAVPAQVDQPQLVVRAGTEQVEVLDGERWISPLGDEIHSALAADLARALAGQDVTALAAAGKPVLSVKVDLRRFESASGAYALIEAAWSLRVKGDTASAPVVCTTRIREAVESGYDALVRGHQRALGRLAADIASAARPMIAGRAAPCP